jgi:hypothetical protein
VKADQLGATGAKTVVTSCHNCVDGLTDLIGHYNLGMQVTQLVNLVANALVVDDRIEENMMKYAREQATSGAVQENL